MFWCSLQSQRQQMGQQIRTVAKCACDPLLSKYPSPSERPIPAPWSLVVQSNPPSPARPRHLSPFIILHLPIRSLARPRSATTRHPAPSYLHSALLCGIPVPRSRPMTGVGLRTCLAPRSLPLLWSHGSLHRTRLYFLKCRWYYEELVR